MNNSIPKWLTELSEADFQFIKRFILASGSLKEMAVQYGISYPTVRNRLNQLIEKVNILESGKQKTEFHKTVKLLAVEGKLDLTVAGTLIKAYENSVENKE